MPLSKKWNYLVGSCADFNLENRIFNSFCLIGLAAIAYNIPFNFIIGLKVSGWLSVALLIIQSFLYYLSRFKKKCRISLILSGIILHVVIFLNYYYNSGIDGPTFLLLLLSFFLVIIISKPSLYLFWVSINVLLVLGLMMHEYYSPDAVSHNYLSRIDRFADIFFSYIIGIIIFLVGLRYVKTHYYKSQEIIENKADNLQTLNQTKDKLFSIVSHDLRAPISSIKNYLEMLSEFEIDLKENSEMKAELLQLTQGTEEMLSNLLLWSKAQMGGITIYETPVNLSDALRPVVEICQNLAANKDLKLTNTINEKIQIIVDANIMQLIVRNLLSNAIKFTAKGGMINIGAICEENTCTIIITDTGMGMSKEKKESIFSLQAEPTYGTANEKGVGLGLLMCKEFTEMQGGKIWFESVEGEGTTFYLSLPNGELL